MKLYMKAASSYDRAEELAATKKELKQNYGVDSRRKDGFILASLLGALRLKDSIEIIESDELYLTSGFGNINVLIKTNDYVAEKKGNLKLFDFLNMLGNTTNYYVAQELGIKAKSIFQISDNFTYFHSLISIYASLSMSKNDAILGSIDVVSQDIEVLKRVAGVDEKSKVKSSVNFQKYSLNASNAICSIEFDTVFYTYDAIVQRLKNEESKIITSSRCDKLAYERVEFYYETAVNEAINEAIKHRENRVFVECYEGKYKCLKIKIL